MANKHTESQKIRDQLLSLSARVLDLGAHVPPQLHEMTDDELVQNVSDWLSDTKTWKIWRAQNKTAEEIFKDKAYPPGTRNI